MILSKPDKGLHLHTYFLMLYFLFAPMEDILSGSIGTVAKYLAILIILIGIYEKQGKIYYEMKLEYACIIWIMLISVLSLAWSISKETTFHRLTAYLLVPAFCLFVGTLEFSNREYDLICIIAIAGGVVASLFAYSSGDLLTGRIILNEGNDPNNFAALLFLPASLSWDKIQTGNKTGRIFYVFAFLLSVFIILLTGSRGGLTALLIMIIVCFVFSGAAKKASVILGILGLFAILWFFILPLLPPNIYDRMFTIANYSSNASRRTIIWEILIKQVFPKMDIYGLGAGCVSVELGNYYGRENGAHNTYLNMIGEFGIFGIPAFLTMIVAFVKETVKNKYYIGTALIAGICVIIFFLDSYAKKFFWNVILIVIIYQRTKNAGK